MSKDKVQSKEVKSEQELANEFVKEYDKLCKRCGFSIVTVPPFKSRDDNTWSIVLQSSVGRLPEKK